jgi:hypothetical protein
MEFREVKVEPYLQQPVCICGSDLKFDGEFVRVGSFHQSEYKFKHICVSCSTDYLLSEDEKVQIKYR